MHGHVPLHSHVPVSHVRRVITHQLGDQGLQHQPLARELEFWHTVWTVVGFPKQ